MTAARTHSLLALLVVGSACAPQADGTRIAAKEARLYSNWAPHQCPTPAQYGQLKPVDISVKRWQEKDRAGSWNPGNYANMVNRPYWAVLFSQNVRTYSLRFSQFDLDVGGGDYLYHWYYGGSGTWSFYNPPALSPSVVGPYPVRVVRGATYTHFAWRTNVSGIAAGYKIDGIDLRCTSTPDTPANEVYVHPNQPYDGLLQATNDVIWVYTTQPAGKTMSFLLWPVNAPTADFDLLASTDSQWQIPPLSGWTDASNSSILGRPEMIVLPAPASDRTVYLAIGSYSGSGQFRFYANIHEPKYPTSINVVTDWSPSDDRKAILRTLMRKLAQAMYFATDGRHLVRRFDIYYNTTSATKPYIRFAGSQTANQCFWGPNCGGCTTVYPTNPNDHLNLTSLNWCGNGCEPSITPSCTCVNTQQFNEEWAAEVALHEVGHCYYGFIDEYWATCNCGHSLMSNWTLESRRNAVDYCTEYSGGQNQHPGTASHTATNSNWTCLESNFPSSPSFPLSTTPDAFYATCDQALGDQPFASFVNIVEHPEE